MDGYHVIYAITAPRSTFKLKENVMTEQKPRPQDNQKGNTRTKTPYHRSEYDLRSPKGPGTDTIVRHGEMLTVSKK